MNQSRLDARADDSEVLRNVWTAVRNSLRTAFSRKSPKYRPEQHYMRGPGPQWHAKQAFARNTAASQKFGPQNG